MTGNQKIIDLPTFAITTWTPVNITTSLWIDASLLSNNINHPTNMMYGQMAKAFADGVNRILF